MNTNTRDKKIPLFRGILLIEQYHQLHCLLGRQRLYLIAVHDCIRHLEKATELTMWVECL